MRRIILSPMLTKRYVTSAMATRSWVALSGVTRKSASNEGNFVGILVDKPFFSEGTASTYFMALES